MSVAYISLLLTGIAILIGLGSVYYTRRQTELMREQDARKQREDKATTEWLTKFQQATDALLKIQSDYLPVHGVGTSRLGLLFPETDLRKRIETHLIDFDHGYCARQPSVDQLRIPVVQQTIRGVLDRVEDFKKRDPDNASKLGL